MFTYAKAIGLGVIALIIAGVFYSYYSRGQKVETLQKEVIVEKLENKDLKDTIEVNEAVTEGGKEVVLVTDTKKTEAAQTQSQIRAEVEAKVQEARTKAAKDAKAAKPSGDRVEPGSIMVEKPVSQVSTPTVLENTISSVRIDGLWTAFCASTPEHPDCKAAKKE